MQPKAKTMMVDTNILVAPPYIHRYTENNQNGWRIQPNGYIKCFLDKDHGGSEAALEVAKGAMRVISTMSNVDLMAIYNPTFCIGIKMTGEMIITMVASRGIHSVSRISIPCSLRLGKDAIKSLGDPWVGQKVYEFKAKELPSWFPLGCRQVAFETWKKDLLTCAKYSINHT